MLKKYVVRLSEQERKELRDVIGKLRGSSLKVRRAHVLLKCDANGPHWTDQQIAEAFDCRISTVEYIRQRLVTEGFYAALDGRKREVPRAKLLDGQQEAKIIAMRLGKPPAGYGRWSLRLLADEVVALEVVDLSCDGPQDAKERIAVHPDTSASLSQR